MIETEKMTLTIGVTPGYGHQNEGAADKTAALEAVVEAAIAIGEKINADTGIFPSFVAQLGFVGYSHDWGCPEGGEFVVVLSGERNPRFCQDGEGYLAAWMRLAEELKKELGQKTAILVCESVKLEYLAE